MYEIIAPYLSDILLEAGDCLSRFRLRYTLGLLA